MLAVGRVPQPLSAFEHWTRLQLVSEFEVSLAGDMVTGCARARFRIIVHSVSQSSTCDRLK